MQHAVTFTPRSSSVFATTQRKKPHYPHVSTMIDLVPGLWNGISDTGLEQLDKASDSHDEQRKLETRAADQEVDM